MPLSGDLDVVELGQVFQMLSSGQKEGRLLIQRPGERREIWFSPAGLALHATEENFRNRVFEVLRKLDRVPEEAIRAALQESEEEGSHPLNILLSLGLFDPEEVNRTYHRIMSEEIYDLFVWRGATFEFVEESLASNAAGASPQFLLRPDNVIMEAARRIDELAQIRALLPDPQEIYLPVVSQEKLNESPIEESDRRILRLLDGLRSVDEVGAKSGLGNFETQKAIAVMIQQGWVRSLDPNDYTAAGTEAFEKGRFAEAAHLYELAAAKGLDLPESLGAAARARESAKDFLGAVKLLRRYAQELANAGERALAAASLRHAVELLPTDLGMREQELRLIVECDAAGDAELVAGRDLAGETRALASAYSEAGNLGKSRDLLIEFHARFPKDRGLHISLAQSHEQSGDGIAAAKLYEALADEADKTRDLPEAQRWLQKAVLLDPERKELAERLAKIQPAIEKLKKRRQHRIVAAVGGGVFLLLAVGIFLRERGASADIESLPVAKLVEQGQFDDAIREYERFQSEHRLTWTSNRADDEIARLKKLKADAEHKKEQDLLASEQERSKLVASAERLLKDAAKAAEEGKLGDALALMKQSLEAGPKDWERRTRVQSEVKDLVEYVRKADDLFAQAKEAEQKGLFADSRRHLRSILDRYPHAPIASKVEIPFEIETTPPGSLVTFEGKKLAGRTPLVLRLRPDAKGKMLLEREGFAPQHLGLSADSSEDVNAALMRVPDRVVPMEGLAVTDPAISANRLYFGLSGGKLLACDLETGKTLWTFAIQGFGEITTPPLPSGDLIYFGASDLKIYAVNSWGELQWKAAVDKAVRATPLLLKDQLYAATESGQVLCLDAQTGKEIWKTALGAPVIASMLHRADAILAGDLRGRVHYLDPLNGEVTRKELFGAGVYSILPVADDRYLLEGEDGRIAVFTMYREKAHWERKGPGIAEIHPVVRGKSIYKAEGKGLLQIDADTGLVANTVSLPVPLLRGLRFGAGALYGRDVEGFWCSVETEGNQLRWRARLPAYEVGFEVDPRRVWILGRDRNLYLFDEAAAQFSASTRR